MTLPQQRALSSYVFDNDENVLQWGAMGANAFRMYASNTPDPEDFVRYYDFVEPGATIHYLIADGGNDIPSSRTEINHDVDGGNPGDASPLTFVSATTETVTFRYVLVPTPTPAPTFYYYLRGIGALDEEGQPSSIISSQIRPIIKAYTIIGKKNGLDWFYDAPPSANTATTPNVGPNANLKVRVKAMSSDKKYGQQSSEIDAWSLAAVPGAPICTAGFDDSHGVYMDIRFSTSGNPAHTQYAIKVVQRNNEAVNQWISAQGGQQADPFWQEKDRWDEGFAHTNLLTASTYYYEVYARNGDRNGGDHIMTIASPIGSGVTQEF